MIKTMARRDHHENSGSRRVIGLSLSIGFFLAWFLLFAPRAVLGPATYAIVNGVSMEPRYETGDLVVARYEGSYQIGQEVVFNADGRLVVHELYSGNANTGWRTKGIHNTWVDPWILENKNIYGSVWFHIPQVAVVFTWIKLNPFGFAGIIALISVIPLFVVRRRKIAAELSDALLLAHEESHWHKWTKPERLELFGMYFAFIVAIVFTTVHYANGNLFTPNGLLLAASLLTAGIVLTLLIKYLFDGTGRPEPEKTLMALTGRLFLVDERPHLLSEAILVKDATVLRHVADKLRLPILHFIDSKAHEFYLIGEDHTVLMWIAPIPDGEKLENTPDITLSL
jgi:signal peptidase I